MAEMILPGTYIEVRPEGLIVPGRVSVGTVGVVGTAAKGVVDEPVLLSGYGEARARFGDYDAWIDGDSNELTLTRALQLAFDHGATSVVAVRVANGAETANFLLNSASGECCRLAAQSPGSWGNELEVNVTEASADSFVDAEGHSGGGPISLDHVPIASARNRLSILVDATQREEVRDIVYDTPPAAGEVSFDTGSGALTFFGGEEPAAADEVTVSYMVDQSNSAQVTIRHGSAEETYTVASGSDLAADINESSNLVSAEALANEGELPDLFADAADFRLFGTGSNTRGANGASNVNYGDGLDLLLNEPVHIVVVAGQSHDAAGADLTSHVQVASSDENKRERIGVVGSALGEELDSILGHNLNSDRIIFVAPGIAAYDDATNQEVVLPGAYTAAAIAGLLASYSPHVSLTNKPLALRGLEERYTNAELKQLVQARVLALQAKLGFKVVKGITTATNTAWHQITTRRIVDYAKYGVRSAADPYIGLLNNERVRGALRATINSFLAEMVNDEMLISYELNVSATREEERQGIALVTIVLRPTFSIDFIKVTMFLE